MSQTQPSSVSLPCVVHVGFSGSRDLWGDVRCGDTQIAEWDDSVVKYLAKRIAEIELPASHFFVGVSQVACGADQLFSRACAKQPGPRPPIQQRIFLPQHRSDFLGATDSEGRADFTKCQRARAEKILDSEQVIQEHVASHSPDRNARFEETNTAILRVSDLVICLVRRDADGKAGGARSFLEQAISREIPALEITVGLTDGRPHFEERWHPVDAYQKFRREPPSLPKELAGIAFPMLPTLPSVQHFCDAVKTAAGTAAEGHQKRFQNSAFWIITGHVAATIFASVALMLHHFHKDNLIVEMIIMTLLGFEVLFLGRSFWRHRDLHHGHAAQSWCSPALWRNSGVRSRRPANGIFTWNISSACRFRNDFDTCCRHSLCCICTPLAPQETRVGRASGISISGRVSRAGKTARFPIITSNSQRTNVGFDGTRMFSRSVPSRRSSSPPGSWVF